jgi:hypothetical protein
MSYIYLANRAILPHKQAVQVNRKMKDVEATAQVVVYNEQADSRVRSIKHSI